MTPNLPLIAWAPDADPTSPGVIASVLNMLPTARGYAPDYSLAASQDSPATLPSAALSAALIKPGTSTPLLMLSTATGLYSVFGSLIDLTPASAPVAASATVPWRFDSFGTIALAVQYANVLHATTNPYGGTDFLAVSGAPTANTMCVQSGFVMLGDTSLTVGWPYPDGWWCSELQDYTGWTPDLATQCARGRLTQTPGGIVRMVAFQNDIIAFKNTSILRGTYVGQANGVWQWAVLSTEVGLASHNSVVETGGVLYFLGNDGFYRFNGGGIERLRSAPWEWFVGDRGSNDINLTSAVYDPVRRLVRWHYRQALQTRLNVCLAYHPDSDRWGWTTSDCAVPLNVPTETLPSVLASSSKTMIFPAGIVDATTHQVKVYSGTPDESFLQTGDVGDDDVVSTLTKVRARFLSAPSAAFARHFYRMRLSDALTTGAEVARVDGKYDFSHAARWHRVTFSGGSGAGMYEIVGFSVNAPASGKR
jgi:hypothetical protein